MLPWQRKHAGRTALSGLGLKLPVRAECVLIPMGNPLSRLTRAGTKRETGHARNGRVRPSSMNENLSLRIASMRLKTNKTWSQQQLAIKLRVEHMRAAWFPHLGAPAAADPRRKDRAGRRAVLVAGDALRPARWLLGRHQRHHRAAIQFGRHCHRFARPAPRHADRRAVRLFVFALRRAAVELHSCRARGGHRLRPAGLRSSSRLAGVTITIIMLVQKAGSRWDLALDRVSEVVLGIVVALAVTTLVFPDRARLRLRDGLAQEFLVLGAFFEAILQGFRGAPAENLASAARGCTGHAARQQPTAGGRAQRALRRPGMARGSEHAVAVWPFALRCPGGAGVRGQRQPSRMDMRSNWSRHSDKLAVDIRTGFHHVAGCIHDWRFHVPPPGMNLEEDIAQLEARMDRGAATPASSFRRRRFCAPMRCNCISSRLRGCCAPRALKPAAPSAKPQE